ncbi:MAG: FIST C-terminal domain-containing protein [Alphaproteobacteria bacterium]
MERFKAGHASASDWYEAAEACAAQLDPPPAGANLGFVYVTDALAGNLGKITAHLVQRSGVRDWVGTTGIGICATGREYFGEPAVAAMVGCFPEGSFSLFERYGDDAEGFLAKRRAWLARSQARFGVVHADPRRPETPGLIPALADGADCFLVGGLASSRGQYAHVAGRLTDGALSGVLFSDEVPVATALTQGCAPIGPVHEISCSHQNIVIELDGRPALEVFREDIGEALAGDLERVGGHIFVAFPVAGSDRPDYMVRNLVGIDPDNDVIAVGAPLEEGQHIMFCRRDSETARADLGRMLADLKRRASEPAQGAVYFSCVGRGPNMFGAPSAELAAIEREIGDVPLVGFFCNGEISHNRLYGYTGVLSLFL